MTKFRVEERIRHMERACNAFNRKISNRPDQEIYKPFCEPTKDLLRKIYEKYPKLQDIKPDNEALPWFIHRGAHTSLAWDLEWINSNGEYDIGNFECLHILVEDDNMEIIYYPEGWRHRGISFNSLEDLLESPEIFERFNL